jgi:hypothetical protein
VVERTLLLACLQSSLNPAAPFLKLLPLAEPSPALSTSSPLMELDHTLPSSTLPELVLSLPVPKPRLPLRFLARTVTSLHQNNAASSPALWSQWALLSVLPMSMRTIPSQLPSQLAQPALALLVDNPVSAWSKLSTHLQQAHSVESLRCKLLVVPQIPLQHQLSRRESSLVPSSALRFLFREVYSTRIGIRVLAWDIQNYKSRRGLHIALGSLDGSGKAVA